MKLAVEGGVPVRNELLPYGHQWIDDEDINAVAEVLRTDWITQGPKVQEFESMVAEYCGVKYAVAVSSGTAALHAACSVAGISHGDEAITSPMTFSATANSIVYCGGRPVFADVEEDTLNIDPEDILRKISPKTKAILPVDFTGHPADLDEIAAIAKEKGIIVIEDAAHALGAEYKCKKLGGLSDLTIFSFHPVKHITTGEGGMVLTNSRKLYERLKIFRHHGILRNQEKQCKDEGSWYYEIKDLGYNLRITDFQCALGISQMKKLDGFIRRRIEIAKRYNKAFAEMEKIVTPVEKKYVKAVYHIYVIKLCLEELKVGRKEVFEALRAENIGVNVHYIPVHLLPYYQRKFRYKNGDHPKAEKNYEKVITLPLFPKMSDKDVSDVIEAVKKVITYYSK